MGLIYSNDLYNVVAEKDGIGYGIYAKDNNQKEGAAGCRSDAVVKADWMLAQWKALQPEPTAEEITQDLLKRM